MIFAVGRIGGSDRLFGCNWDSSSRKNAPLSDLGEEIIREPEEKEFENKDLHVEKVAFWVENLDLAGIINEMERWMDER